MYSSTLRYTSINEDTWINYLEKGGSVLLCGWHQQILPAIGYYGKFRHFSPSIMISQSNDGDIGAGISQRTGWRPIRGSSSRGGLKALKGIIRELKSSRLAAHIVDGPQGPAGVVKPGVISLALAAHAVIVPVFITADRAWYLNSWDRFMIPKPFSRIQLKSGNMIHMNEVKEKKDVELLRVKLESVMLPHLKKK